MLIYFLFFFVKFVDCGVLFFWWLFKKLNWYVNIWDKILLNNKFWKMKKLLYIYKCNLSFLKYLEIFIICMFVYSSLVIIYIVILWNNDLLIVFNIVII